MKIIKIIQIQITITQKILIQIHVPQIQIQYLIKEI